MVASSASRSDTAARSAVRVFIRLLPLATIVLVGACTSPTTVTIRTTGTPEFVRYRSDGGAWQRPDAGSAKTYVFEALDYFDFLAVCTNEGGAYGAEQLSATPEDGPEYLVVVPDLLGSGCAFVDEPESVVKVSGVMKQAGDIAAGMASDRSVGNDWTYSLYVPPGVYDLIASTALEDLQNGRVVIRRRESVPGDVTFSLVDAVSEGQRLSYANLEVAGAVGLIKTVVTIQTASGTTAAISGSASTIIATIPDELLEPDDRQVLSLQSSGTPYGIVNAVRLIEQRGIGQIYQGLAIAFPEVPEIQYYDDTAGPVRVQWHGHDAEQILLRVNSICQPNCTPDTPPSASRVTATRRWLQQQVQSHEVTFDPSGIPGYDPAWYFDRAPGYQRSLSIRDSVDRMEFSTTITDTVGAQ